MDWTTEPFRFTVKEDRYWGRGTTDDKGPALTALCGAKYALAHGATVNIHFLWEAEEEIGIPHFESTIRQRQRSGEDRLGRGLGHRLGVEGAGPPVPRA